MTLDALKQQYAKIIKIIENVEPERSPETIWRKSLRRFIWKNNFGDILETVLETCCVSRLGKSDIRAGRPLVNYLLIIERGAVGDSPPRGALAEPKSW